MAIFITFATIITPTPIAIPHIYSIGTPYLSDVIQQRNIIANANQTILSIVKNIYTPLFLPLLLSYTRGRHHYLPPHTIMRCKNL